MTRATTPRPGAMLRLALAGTRVDLLRIGVSVLVSALATGALLSAVTVTLIGPGDGPYTSDLLNQGGLHPGVVIALIGICIPTLVLLAQCSRIGAPARDRRLSAMRLAGASPREVTRLVAVESGIATLLGALLGTAVFFVLRATLGGYVRGRYPSYRPATVPDHYEAPIRHFALRLPTDVLPPWWAVVAVVIAVPVLVSALTGRALRRVAFTPFGTVRSRRARTPRLLPLVLVVVGLGVFFTLSALLDSSFGQSLGAAPVLALMFVALVLIVAGLLSGQGALTLVIGRRLAGRTSSAALLLAARRMTTDPFAITRSSAVLTAAVVIAAGAQRLRDVTLAEVSSDQQGFFGNAYDLIDLVLIVVTVLAACGVLVAGAEGIVARRRTYAGVIAAGTPRSVVARAVLAELLLPLVPSVVLAAAVGTAAAVGFFGWHTQTGSENVLVELSWGPLLGIVAFAIAMTALVTALSLVFLRSATDIGELRRAV